MTFTFASVVTAAGIVWTDGRGDTTFEAFGPGMVSLGTIGPVSIDDANFKGGTAEGRFFGVQDISGIIAIKVSMSQAVGFEVDHLQFGSAPSGAVIPEPSSIALLITGGLCLIGYRRRRKHAAWQKCG